MIPLLLLIISQNHITDEHRSQLKTFSPQRRNENGEPASNQISNPMTMLTSTEVLDPELTLPDDFDFVNLLSTTESSINPNDLNMGGIANSVSTGSALSSDLFENNPTYNQHHFAAPEMTENIFIEESQDQFLLSLGDNFANPTSPIRSTEEALRKSPEGTESHFNSQPAILNQPTNVQINSHQIGKSAIWLAIENDHADIVLTILKHEPRSATEIYNGATVLHAVARKGMVDVVKELLIRCAYLGVRKMGSPGQASNYMDQSDLEPLIHMCDGSGMTALHVAVEANQGTIVALLLQTGIGLEIRDDRGRTALHIAGSAGYAGLVELLLNNGADASARMGKR